MRGTRLQSRTVSQRRVEEAEDCHRPKDGPSMKHGRGHCDDRGGQKERGRRKSSAPDLMFDDTTSITRWLSFGALTWTSTRPAGPAPPQHRPAGTGLARATCTPVTERVGPGGLCMGCMGCLEATSLSAGAFCTTSSDLRAFKLSSQAAGIPLSASGLGRAIGSHPDH